MCVHGHNCFTCYMPPQIIDRLANSSNQHDREMAIKTIKLSAYARTARIMMPSFGPALRSATGGKYRAVYDMEKREFPLPGKLMREEGGGKSKDPAVNEAYDHSGTTYDCYLDVFKRNSLDGNGMKLVSSVHFAQGLQNAFWNGTQMAYGDGDGQIFVRFTKSLDVVAHELTHGVVSYTANLRYQGESGALNESFADVMSAVVTQWSKKQSVAQADWLMGDELLGPRLKEEAAQSGATLRAFRVFDEGKAYENHPTLGDDPQPKHMKDKYTGDEDYGGVHINSGIPNHAFYRAAKAIGGNSWEVAGQIWYKTLLALHSTSSFRDCAQTSLMIAQHDYGVGSKEATAVAEAWQEVGLLEEALV
ncbi:M4 family metallopeptidase [Rhizobium laguerreae]|uniref:M4 family metallopeptidase n=1 Tax=Rhizobium laguerreae TaxID=1076926 RepID=UPI0014423ECD|nr:M4 family metallopeptidase [Rhizobium laguerreae]NKN12288.1 M4 family peptidase [Rhizobium laguerreae]